MVWTVWIFLGSVFAALSVGAGAFGAHYLKDKLTPEHLAVFETAAKYQMYHALALIALGVVATRVENISIKIAGVLFVLGILLFSGSLYGLVLAENRGLGMITPVGGACLILAWLLLAFSVLNLV